MAEARRVLIDVVGGDARDILRAIAVATYEGRRARGEDARSTAVWSDPATPAVDADVWPLSKVVAETPMDFETDSGTLPAGAPASAPAAVDLRLAHVDGRAAARDIRFRLNHLNSKDRLAADAESLIILLGSETTRPSAMARRAASAAPASWDIPFVFLAQPLIEDIERKLARNDRLTTVVVAVTGVEYLFAGRRRILFGERLLTPLEMAANATIMTHLLAITLAGAPEAVDLLCKLEAWRERDRKRRLELHVTSANGFTIDDGEPNVDRETGRPLLTPDGLAMVDPRRGAAGQAPFPRNVAEAPNWTPFNPATAVFSLFYKDMGGLDLSALLDRVAPGRRLRRALPVA